MRFRDDMLRPKVLVFMLPLLLPIGQPRTSANGLNGAGADSAAAPAPAAMGWPDADRPNERDKHQRQKRHERHERQERPAPPHATR